MYRIMVAGAGKIGSAVTCFLASSGDYEVFLADKHFNGQDISRLRAHLPGLKVTELDVEDRAGMIKTIKENSIQAVISTLPYFCNIPVAEVARECGIHYFDPTEDVEITQAVTRLAQGAKSAFVPQCGLAPGFINIAAHTLMQHFETLDTVKLRVGALPQQASNMLNYALTWSTEGVINEYGNMCHAVENGAEVAVLPLEGLETLALDGQTYEAFNTSGGLGSLAKTYAGKVRNMQYKTLRYPGHCEKMRLLMNDLKLNEDRETLKRILERAVPKTYQDIVLIYVSVTGSNKGQFIEESYVKKVYPQEVAGLHWSAIQVTTAAGITTVVDYVMKHADKYHGLVLQEQFTLQDIFSSRFGKYYE